MREAALLVAGLASAACGLETSGLGGGGGGQPGVTAGESDDGNETEADTGMVTGTTAEGTSGDATADGTTSDTGDGPGTTGPGVDPCDPPPLVVYDLDLSAASFDAAMVETTLSGLGNYAYSEQENAGTASFAFDVQCEDEFRVWALVHDPQAGFEDLGTLGDPDSYFVAFDGDGPTHWWYGCQMSGDNPLGGPAWAWVSVRESQFCIPSDFRRTLAPGPHHFRITNREAGTHMVTGLDIGYVAALSRVIITNDPNYSP